MLCVLGSTFVRARTALGSPEFPAAEAARVRSDPALIYYVAERIAEEGGVLPPEARADPRVEHPEGVDLLREFTVAQEFPVAWVHRALGGRVPLSESALWTMAFFASLGAVGAWLLAREVTGSARAGLFAAVLWSLIPANYRTIGFVLVREDFSFSFFALHLGLLARASRLDTHRAFGLAGVSLGIALASWHATGFLLLLELLVLGFWFVCTGRNPFARNRVWVCVAVVAAFALAVPALRAKYFLVSAPTLFALALYATARTPERWQGSRLARAGVLAGASCIAASLLALLGRFVAGAADYGHVAQLLMAKVLLLGQRPVQPETLSFDVRLMWQSSFETMQLSWSGALRWGPALALFAWCAHAAKAAWSGGDVNARTGARALVSGLALASLPTAWLLQRLVILPGFLAPVIAAGLAVRGSGQAAKTRTFTWMLAACVAQAAVFGAFLSKHTLYWHLPGEHRSELSDAIAYIDERVPAGAAVASDFVTSTAILAGARRPVLFQPKYESRQSRARIREFTDAFFRAPPDQFYRLLDERFRCGWLLVDKLTLGRDMRYLAGIADQLGEGLASGTAAALLLGAEGDPALQGFVSHGPAGARFFELFELRRDAPR